MYTLMEYTLNGAHMMNPFIVGYDMNFEDAVNVIKEKLSKNVTQPNRVEIYIDTSEEFAYSADGPDYFLPTVNVIRNKELHIYTKE